MFRKKEAFLRYVAITYVYLYILYDMHVWRDDFSPHFEFATCLRAYIINVKNRRLPRCFP